LLELQSGSGFRNYTIFVFIYIVVHLDGRRGLNVVYGCLGVAMVGEDCGVVMAMLSTNMVLLDHLDKVQAIDDGHRCGEHALAEL
jgi:hypothetical protein